MDNENKYSIDNISFLHIPRKKPDPIQPTGVRQPPPMMDIIQITNDGGVIPAVKHSTSAQGTHQSYQSRGDLRTVDASSQNIYDVEGSFNKVDPSSQQYHLVENQQVHRVDPSSQIIKSEPVSMSYVEPSSQQKSEHTHELARPEESRPVAEYTHELERPDTSRPLAEHTHELARPDTSRPAAEHTHELAKPDSSRPVAEHTHELVRPEISSQDLVEHTHELVKPEISSQDIEGHTHILVKPSRSAHTPAEHTHELARPGVSGNTAIAGNGGINNNTTNEAVGSLGNTSSTAGTAGSGSTSTGLQKPDSMLDSMMNSINQEIENLQNLPGELVNKVQAEAKRVGTDLMQAGTQLSNSALNDLTTDVKSAADALLKNPKQIANPQFYTDRVSSSANKQIDNANTAINKVNEYSNKYLGTNIVEQIPKIGTSPATTNDLMDKIGGGGAEAVSRTPSISGLSSLPLMAYGGRDDSQYIFDSSYEIKPDGTKGLRGTKEAGDPLFDAIPDDHEFISVDSILNAGDNKTMFEAWSDKYSEISMAPFGYTTTTPGGQITRERFLGGSFYTDGTGGLYMKDTIGGSGTQNNPDVDTEKSYKKFRNNSSIELDYDIDVFQSDKSVYEGFKIKQFVSKTIKFKKEDVTWRGGRFYDWSTGKWVEFGPGPENEIFWLEMKDDVLNSSSPAWTPEEIEGYEKTLYLTERCKITFTSEAQWEEFVLDNLTSDIDPSWADDALIKDNYNDSLYKDVKSMKSFKDAGKFEVYQESRLNCAKSGLPFVDGVVESTDDATDRLADMVKDLWKKQNAVITFATESDWDNYKATTIEECTAKIDSLTKDNARIENLILDEKDVNTKYEYEKSIHENIQEIQIQNAIIDDLKDAPSNQMTKLEERFKLYEFVNTKVKYYTFTSEQEQEFNAFLTAATQSNELDLNSISTIRSSMYGEELLTKTIHTFEGPPAYPAEKIGLIAIENFVVSDMSTETIESINAGLYGDIPIALAPKQPQQIDITFLADAEQYTLRWVVDYQKYMFGESLVPGYMRPYKKCCTQITLYSTRFNRQTVYAKTFYCIPLFNINMSLLGENVKKFPTTWLILGAAEYKCKNELESISTKKVSETFDVISVPPEELETPEGVINTTSSSPSAIESGPGYAVGTFNQGEHDEISGMIADSFVEDSLSDKGLQKEQILKFAEEQGIEIESTDLESMATEFASKANLDGILGAAGLLSSMSSTVVITTCSWEVNSANGIQGVPYSSTDRSKSLVSQRIAFNNKLSLERGIESVLELYNKGVKNVRLLAGSHLGVKGAYPHSDQSSVATQTSNGFLDGIYAYQTNSDTTYDSSDPAYGKNRKTSVFVYSEESDSRNSSKFYSTYSSFESMKPIWSNSGGTPLTYEEWEKTWKNDSNAKSKLVDINLKNSGVVIHY